MSEKSPISHLGAGFFITPKFARQIMTYKEWQETAAITQCRIVALGETYELTAKHMGGGMYEVRADLTYWKGGKPQKAKA